MIQLCTISKKKNRVQPSSTHSGHNNQYVVCEVHTPGTRSLASFRFLPRDVAIALYIIPKSTLWDLLKCLTFTKTWIHRVAFNLLKNPKCQRKEDEVSVEQNKMSHMLSAIIKSFSIYLRASKRHEANLTLIYLRLCLKLTQYQSYLKSSICNIKHVSIRGYAISSNIIFR